MHLRSKEGLGYLPQQRSVFNMSVYDNIIGIAQISIKNSQNQKAITEKLLDEFNLQHLRTLNASVLSTSRIIPAILEQNQQKDGSVKVPKVLVKYLGKKVIK